jgi:hypothetical protein
MTDLQTAILARIDATPYRAPTIADFSGNRADISSALAELMAAGVIDTATGDSGVTYTRRKVYAATPTPSPHAPILPARKEQSFSFPSKFAQPVQIVKNTPAERVVIRAAKVPERMQKRERAALEKAHLIVTRTKASASKKVAAQEEKRRTSRSIADTVNKYLTGPMSLAQFGKAAGLSKTIAASMLYRSVVQGRIFKDDRARPKLYFFAVPVAAEIAQFRAAAQELKRRNYGLEPDKIAAEYRAGGKVKAQAKKWGTSAKTIRAILRDEGVTLRTPQECSAALRGTVREITPEHREKIRAQLSKARAEGRLKHQAMKEENAALKAQVAELTRHKCIDAFAGRAEL